MAKPRLSEGRIPFQLGIEAGVTPPVDDEPYQGDAYYYDDPSSDIGSIADGTVIDSEYIYD